MNTEDKQTLKGFIFLAVLSLIFTVLMGIAIYLNHSFPAALFGCMTGVSMSATLDFYKNLTTKNLDN